MVSRSAKTSLPSAPHLCTMADRFKSFHRDLEETFMSHGKSDEEVIKTTHNTARYFVETRHVAWVLLIATCAWGIFGYTRMPQRKDPEYQVRMAVAMTAWPGASAER